MLLDLRSLWEEQLLALLAVDAAVGSEAAGLILATLLATEAGVGDDSAAAITTATLFGTTDTGAGADVSTLVTATLLGTAETGAGADVSTLVTATLFGTTETGAGADAATLVTAVLLAVDAAAGADLVVTLDAGATNFATDAGVGAEGTSIVTQLNALLAVDAGTGVEVSPSTVTHTAGRHRFVWLEAAAGAPIVAEALMENLVEEYGENRGKHVYFAMEREQKGPFAPGNKYDAASRGPQPVVVVQSRRPPPHAPMAPAANAPKAAEETLRAFVHDALARTGVKKEPPAT